VVAAIKEVTFVPVPGYGWIASIDDRLKFRENPQYRGPGASPFAWAFSTIQLGVYQPIAWVLLDAQFVLFGLVASRYHLASVGVHAASCRLDDPDRRKTQSLTRA
jgi:hypothetical protein